uniref:type IV secretory system conjugative DNA transfer family protein n=1 Tax=Sphingobacterium composti TaxID=363260 RepID=UPI001356F516
MKRVEHQHAKKRGRGFLGKMIVYLVVFFVGSTLLSSLFLAGLGASNRTIGSIVVYSVLGFIIWKLFKKYKHKISFNKDAILNPQIKQEVGLNLVLNGKVNIQNPYAGIFISGGAGAGKSKSIIEPLINDAGQKGFTGVVYDFKFPELASYVNTAYKNTNIKPYFINFTDLSRSHRINPIAPELMINDSFAREFAYSILANLNPSMISKPDFWSENSTALLASVFWYLKKKHPQYCTLPHAMSMILQPDLESLLNTLDKEQKCADMIAPIMTAYANKADNQLAGVISSLQISLSKINTEEVYYLTSKSDFNLDLNNPNSRGMLVIGNSPTLATTYSPIIGLILTSISKLLNQQGKEK